FHEVSLRPGRQDVLRLDSQLAQDLQGDAALLLGPGGRSVHGVYDEVRLADLGERRAEGRDQRRGELPDEPDGVDEDDVVEAARGRPGDSGVECREEPVGDVGGLASQAVEEGRFSGVGITGDRDLEEPPPSLAADGARLLDLAEVLAKAGNSLA